MCGKPSKPKAPPKPQPDTTVADRGADSAVDASLGRRVGVVDDNKPGTLGGANPAAAGGPTSSILGG